MEKRSGDGVNPRPSAVAIMQGTQPARSEGETKHRAFRAETVYLSACLVALGRMGIMKAGPLETWAL